MIITRTPFRLSFFGGGTDYAAWYANHKGLVIGTTFARYCYVSCRRLPPFFDYQSRIVYSQVEVVKGRREIKHPAVRGCLEYLKLDEGLEIHHDGDLPARSGIGSSSSFTVGLLLGLHGLRHELLTKKELADEAITVEQEILRENVGIQDQIFAAYGGFRVVEIDSHRNYQANPLPLPPEYLKGLEDHVLLAFTGLTRIASDIAREKIDNIKRQRSRIGEVLSIATEALDLFRKRAEFEAVGKLLDKSWWVKRSLAESITNPQIDELYAAAQRAGAYGGKLLGAGGGGFFMLFAPPERHQRIKDALHCIKVWAPVKFESEGARIVFHTDGY